MRKPTLASLVVLLAATPPALAAPNDWCEGDAERDDGATRDFYNRAGSLAWTRQLGDWRDAAGARHGDAAYATTTVDDTDTPRFVEWDVTALVQAWLAGDLQNQGLLLRAAAGGSINFASREASDPSRHPQLAVVTGTGTVTLAPEADTHLDPSTYQCLGREAQLSVRGESNTALIRFPLDELDGATVTGATLRLFTTEQYGTTAIGAFRVDAGRDGPPPALETGIAAAYEQDAGIAADPDVVFFADFEGDDWADGWTRTGGEIAVVAEDAALGFEPLLGRALRARMPAGDNLALDLGFEFADRLGTEPDEIYYRYYLRFASDWNQSVDGGKMPGFGGTYGVAGWGGRPSDGTNGWSARGSFSMTIPPGNPLAGGTPLGFYVYHADMTGEYGDIWIWTQGWGAEGFGGILPTGEWHCIDEYVRMNTPTVNDGVLRAWVDGRLAFEKTDLRFRDVDTLHVEEVWMNVYHGGTAPSPYDQHLYIDHVVVARSFVGPMGDAPIPDGGPPPWDASDPDTGTPDVAAETDGGADGGGGDGGTTGADDGSGCACALAARAGAGGGASVLLVLAAARRTRRRPQR